MAIVQIDAESTVIQNYYSAAISPSGTYAAANVDTGNSNSTTNNGIGVVSPWVAGDQHLSSWPGYILRQSIMKFDFSSIPPESRIISATFKSYINLLIKNSGDYTAEVRKHSALSSVEPSCTSSSLCTPMEAFYKGSNITSNTSGLLASLDTTSKSSGNTYSFTSDPNLLTNVVPGQVLWCHLSTSRNRLETQPGTDETNNIGLGDPVGLSPFIEVEYEQSGFFMGADF